MSAGRRTPPRVVTLPEPQSAGYQASQDADAAFFQAHPNALHYERAYIPGEAPDDLPPGTRVIVKRWGLNRVRAFQLPSGVEVCN